MIKQPPEPYSGAGMTRRHFTQFGLAAAVLSATGLPDLASAVQAPQCGGQAPQHGGQVRYGVWGSDSGASFDPGSWGTDALNIQGTWAGVYNNLTEVSASGELVGELAESFEASDDLTRWVFKLRKGVEFHNAKTLCAADVIASINHHRGDASTSAAKSIVAGIADLRAEDDNTVLITLHEPNADFAYLMSDYHLPIGAAQDGRIDWNAHIGTGGYSIQHVDFGVRMDLLRQPNYWKPDAAFFDRVELLTIADTTAAMNALLSGDLDVIERIDMKTIEPLKRASHIVVEEVSSSQHVAMPMWTDTAPFNNLDVRLAMKLAVNRQDMVDRILRGSGQVANDHPIAPSYRFFADDIEQRVYDPERARFHLKKAGYERLSVDLRVAEVVFAGAVDAAVLYKEQAARAGIDVNVIRVPSDGYWSNVWSKVPFCMHAWSGRSTEDWMFSLVYTSDAVWNDTRWRSKRFDQLLKQARAEREQVKRANLYRELQLLVRDQGGVIVPMFADYVFARSSKVARGPQIAANLAMDGWKSIERWWLS